MTAPPRWLIMVAGLLAGCATVPGKPRLVEPGPVTVAGMLDVEPGRPWSAETTGRLEEWTVDGFRLHSVRFYLGVADGERVLAGPRETEPPPFRKGMTPREVRDVVVATLFPGRPVAGELREAPFGTRPGFRFDVQHVLGPLERRALVAGAIVNHRLHLIVYDAAAVHYYARYLPDVERLLASLRLRQP